jgi:hypothetical protein
LETSIYDFETCMIHWCYIDGELRNGEASGISGSADRQCSGAREIRLLIQS